uniref:Tospeak-6 n=1 Tax=Homo sapiens TaxID=9606 RepID=F4YA18_HUMAN|nr:tospeak-6 [Homo sapiens]
MRCRGGNNGHEGFKDYAVRFKTCDTD